MPLPGETYQEYLDSFGIQHFTAREVTLLRSGVWCASLCARCAAMVPTLQPDMVREELGHPLAVGSGYRPTDYNSAVGAHEQPAPAQPGRGPRPAHRLHGHRTA